MSDAAAQLLLLAIIGVVVGYALLRRHQRRTDETRREASREAYVREEEARLHRALFDEIDGFFPAIAPEFREHLKMEATPEEALARAITSTPGVLVGTAWGCPALLADTERRKHLYIVGKTGSGKTTLLLHLIKADLEAGRGVGVIAPEAELFRDWLLPMIPDGREDDVIYFAPGNPKNPVTWNPLAVEDPAERHRAAEDLFAIFKRTVGEAEFGARMTPLLGNAFACLVGRPEATLWEVKRLLEDANFRREIVDEIPDDYLRDFWLTTFPQYPKGSHIPIVNRLDQFLRPVSVRQALCSPISSFSIRQALDEGRILLFDLSGLAPDSCLLLGQMLLSKFQLELMRREILTEGERTPFYLYADEFQTFAGVAEGTWRELLSRGRRYGLALTLAHQFPSQLPEGLRDEIFGNIASLVSFGLSAKDTQAIRKEFLMLPGRPAEAEPVSLETLVTLRTGQAVARLGSGAYAVRLQTADPVEPPPGWRGEEMKTCAWARHRLPGRSDTIGPRRHASSDRELKSSEDFLE